MSTEPNPAALVPRTVRLEHRQWERLDRLANRAALTRAERLREIVDLGANEFEQALNDHGGQA